MVTSGGEARPHPMIKFVIEKHEMAPLLNWLADAKKFFSDYDVPEVPLDYDLTIEDVVEGVTVQYAVRLIPNLGHHFDVVRMDSMHLLQNLALIFDKDKKLSSLPEFRDLSARFQHFNDGNRLLHYSFGIIGRHLSRMTVAIVAGLESYLTHPQADVREVAISVITRLICENSEVFVTEDQLSSVWNLFLLVKRNSGDRRAVSRVTLCECLGTLAPTYVLADKSLLSSIVERLLSLDDKTAKEINAIRFALDSIFTHLKSATSEKERYALLACFKNLLTSSEENHYDLFEWSLTTYITTVSGGTIPLQNCPPLDSFVESLSVHYRASPPLIRYGAAICLYTTLTICPSVIDNNRSLFTYIISGCLDNDHHTAFLYLSALLVVSKFNQSHELTDAINLITQQHFASCHTLKILQNSEAADRTSLGSVLPAHVSKQIDDKNIDSSSMSNVMSEEPSDVPEIPASMMLTPKDIQFGPSPTRSSIQDGNEKDCEDDNKRSNSQLCAILKMAAVHAPPLSGKLLQSLVNSLDFIPPTHQYRQLDLIRLWVSKAKRIDMLLIRSLLPKLTHEDEIVQQKTVAIFAELSPNLADSVEEKTDGKGPPAVSQHDLCGLAAYFRRYMRRFTVDTHNCSANGLYGLMEAVKSFPYELLDSEQLLLLLDTLVSLVFSPSRDIRRSVYQLMASCRHFWHTPNLLNEATAVLFLCLGDTSRENLDLLGKCIVHYLVQAPSLNELTHHFVSVWPGITDDKPLVYLRNLDKLSQFIASNFEAFRGLVLCFKTSRYFEVFWSRFASVHPSEIIISHPSEQLTVHEPWWLALLYSHLDCLPLVTSSENSETGSQSGRSLQPTILQFVTRFLDSADFSKRWLSCVTATRCVFVPGGANMSKVKELLVYFGVFFDKGVRKPLKMSALCIMRLLIQLKLNGVNRYIVTNLGDRLLGLIEGDPYVEVQVEALEMLEMLLLVLPGPMLNGRFDRVRDALRTQIIHQNSKIESVASRVYQLLHALVPPDEALDCYNYLQHDLVPAIGSNWEAQADPLLKGVSGSDKNILVAASISAAGALRAPKLCEQIIRNTFQFINDQHAQFRAVAIDAVVAQSLLLAKTDKKKAAWGLWICLPLICDNFLPVRVRFACFAKSLQSPLEVRQSLLSPEVEDELLVRDMIRLEDLPHGIVDITRSKDIFIDNFDERFAYMLPPAEIKQLEAEVSSQPSLNYVLLKRIQDIVKDNIGEVALSSVDEVLYYMRSFIHTPMLAGSAMIVMSEFCCLHMQSTREHVVQTLLLNVSNSVTTADNRVRALVEGCVIGLKNISDHSLNVFKNILENLATMKVQNEGDLLCVLHLCPIIRTNLPEKAQPLIDRYSGFLLPTSTASLEHRILGVRITGELGMITSAATMGKIISALGKLQQEASERSLQTACESQLSKFVELVGMDHPIYKFMLEQMDKNAISSNQATRLRTLMQFKFLGRGLKSSVVTRFCTIFLCDPSVDIRKCILEVMLDGSLPSLVELTENIINMPELRRGLLNPNESSSAIHSPGKGNILSKGHNKQYKRINTAFNENEKRENNTLVVPLPNLDSLNRQYYLSRAFAETCSIYGLDREYISSMSRVPVCKTSGLDFISEVGSTEAKSSARLKDVDDIILYDLTPIVSQLIATDIKLVEVLLKDALQLVQLPLREHNEVFNVVCQQSKHACHIFIAVLIAYEKAGGETSFYVGSLHKLIHEVHAKCTVMRGDVFSAVQQSLLFQSDFVDMPIATQEQFDRVETHRRLTAGHSSGKGKDGGRIDVVTMQIRRNEIAEEMRVKTATLRGLTSLHVKAIQCVGMLYEKSENLTDPKITDGFHELLTMFENEHRGIRESVIRILIRITSLHATPNKVRLAQEIRETAEALIDQMTSPALYRKKADTVFLVAHILLFITDPAKRTEAINKFIAFWDDPDSIVRRTSIQMVQFVGELDIPEMITFLGTDGQNSPLMVQITKRVNDPGYIEKDSLNELLKWYFARHVSAV